MRQQVHLGTDHHPFVAVVPSLQLSLKAISGGRWGVFPLPCGDPQAWGGPLPASGRLQCALHMVSSVVQGVWGLEPVLNLQRDGH